MLREVGNIFSRAFRMIFQYPIFAYLPAAYYIYNLAYYLANQYMPPVSLVVLGWLDIIVRMVFIFGVPIVFILIVLRAGDAIDLRTIIEEAKGYFWRYIGQFLVGMFLALLINLPFGCVLLPFYTLSERSLIFVWLWFWASGFVATGYVTLGTLFLIDGGKSMFRNSVDGFRMLKEHLSFFVAVYCIETLISILNYSFRIFLGSLFTGINLSSISFSSMSNFTASVVAIVDTPAVHIYNVIFGTFLFSFYLIVSTLAYVRCKNLSPNSAPSFITNSTEN